MNHFIDIHLLPDPEFKSEILMNALFSKFHRSLVSTGYGEIGVSFPKVDKRLGDIMRIHGTGDNLDKFMNVQWLQGMKDYVRANEIMMVPGGCKYRVVKRVQAKSNTERLLRRSVKKGWLSPEEAATKIAESINVKLDFPFIRLKSSSTGQYFPLFIKHDELCDSPISGQFSAYGLSQSATIPWF